MRTSIHVPRVTALLLIVLLWAIILAPVVIATRAHAQNMGSAAGGQAANQSGLAGCQYNASLPTLSPGQQVALQCDASGHLITNATGGGGQTIDALAIVVTPTVTMTTYGANTVAGTLMTFANACQTNGGSGTLQDVNVTYGDVQNSALNFYFFDTNPTNSTFTNAGNISVAAGDNTYLRKIVKISDPTQSGSTSSAQANNQGVQYHCATGSTSVYGVLVTTAGYPVALSSTSDINVSIGVQRYK